MNCGGTATVAPLASEAATVSAKRSRFCSRSMHPPTYCKGGGRVGPVLLVYAAIPQIGSPSTRFVGRINQVTLRPTPNLFGSRGRLSGSVATQNALHGGYLVSVQTLRGHAPTFPSPPAGEGRAVRGLK